MHGIYIKKVNKIGIYLVQPVQKHLNVYETCNNENVFFKANCTPTFWNPSPPQVNWRFTLKKNLGTLLLYQDKI